MIPDIHALHTVLIARQPILLTGGETWGYSLRIAQGEAGRGPAGEPGAPAPEATLAALEALAVYAGPDAPRVRFLLGFEPEDIARNLPHSLPPRATVVQIPEIAAPGTYYLDGLRELKQDGYQIAVDQFIGRAGADPLWELADVICVDIASVPGPELAALAAEVHTLNAAPLARNVQTAEQRRLTELAGFTLFEGYAFHEPEIFSGNRISSSTATRLKLFRTIEREDPDLDEVAEAIKADTGISYRLLQYLGSAHFSLSHKVTSIHQAVVMTGWKPLQTWLRILILLDAMPETKPMQLAYDSAQRAKFFELMALVSGRRDEADTLNLLGLFSLLEPMFDMPMAEILKHLPLDETLAEALCGVENRYAPWLRLAEAIDHSRWQDVGAVAFELSMPPGSVSRAYMDAFVWADQFFGSAHGAVCVTDTQIAK